MEKMKKIALKSLLLLMVLSVMILAGCGKDAPVVDDGTPEIPTEDGYSYENPEEAKAEPDAGFVIDGILDEEAYKNNNWLYLHNDDAGNNVDIAMTTYFGEKGMYFVYDVTESVPIYVNLDRSPTLNSCIEMYLVPSDATNAKDNHFFEIDLLPTGDIYFKKSNGAYGYTDVSTTSDKMAVLGATTKGGEVNTPECYGYYLELFIPWDYMQWLGVDTEAMKNDFVLVNPAHITSHNFSGKNNDLDRYWYHYVQQCGIEFGDVAQYFRFDGNGVIGTVPVVLQQGENCTISGDAAVIPGMKTVVTIKPEDGYALNSILVDGEEEIQNVSYNEDGSVTLTVRSSVDGVNVSAKAEPVTEGKKTLSGKVVLHNLNKDDLEGVLISYTGPKGEKPVTIDEQGRFELKDMEPGYYVLKVEKKDYASITRGIYLNRDIFTSLVLEYDLFVPTSGSSFIMDEQNDGVLYKMSGNGHVMSNVSYKDFTYSINLKYDEELAKQGTGDMYLQQRSGMRILFSNGKYWHIDLLKEGNKYILQYAKHTGNDSIFNWKTIHTLNADQVARYTSEEGLELKIMRHGRYVAVWLYDTLIKVEVLNKQYSDCTAQIGMEAWISNRTVMEFPFSILPYSAANVIGSPFHIPAKSWGISGQYMGYVNRYPLYERQWLDGQINTNDVTVIAKDLSPDTKDYSFAFIFKFSNKQQFRIRLNHTDTDGAYRIQSMAGSTVAPAWKNAYTLTPEEAELVKGDGIAYRVQILGTTAYVYLDGKEVCSYDLSTVVATGKPSGIENATAKVSFSLDGNMTGVTMVPFKMVDSTKNVTVKVAEIAGGTVLTDKESYKMGETVQLTLAGDPGYYYTELKVNGVKVEPNWDGTYSFGTSENRYEVTAEFKPGKFAENENSAWELLKQNCGILKMNSHDSGNSGWLEAAVDGNDIDTLIRDASPDAKDFSMIYHFTFSNGETLCLRLNHTDSDGKYRVQVMSGSTVSAAWKNHYTLNDAQAAKIANKGVNFRVVTKGGNALVYIDEIKVATLDLTKVVSSGEPSNIADSGVRVKIRVDGNLGQEMEIPFELLDTSKLVNVNIADMTNGTVTADKNIYQLGETVTLTVTPASGYSQKLYINGEVLKLDWKTNTYSFVADKNEYDITGSFEPSINAVAMDAGRWDSANQAHGILNAYYTANDDAWWMQLKGEYVSLATVIKNYLPTEDTQDGNGKVGFSVALRATMDNGKTYAFRIYNDKGTYAYSRSGASGSVAGWGNWKKLDDAAVAALTGDGVEFKLKRTAGNALTLYINGVVMDTYTMEGVTSANKVVSLDINHYGNKGQHIEIPFELKTPTDAPDVQLNIAEMTGGTVIPELNQYQVGETVTLIVTPDAGYAQKLYINGQPLMLDWKTNTYSFEATKEVYDITGSFEPVLDLAPSDAGRWDIANQAHGVLNAYYPVNDDSWWMDVKGEYESITVMAKNYLPVADSQDGNGKVGFAVILRVTMDNGKTYAFRVYNDKGTYAHSWYGSGGSVTGWGSWKNIHNAYAADFNGDGVEYKLERTASDKLTLSLNGNVVETYTMSGVTSANKVVSMSAQHNGNKGVKVEVPFVVTKPDPRANVQLNIADLTNGTVTADKERYKVGDTVTLTVTPDEGNAQKLYINGQPLMLDWKTNTYSFEATEEVYNITGSFEPSINAVAKDAGRWDTANQAHGIFTTYYPANDDAWWMEIKGEYASLTVQAKNYLPTADSQDGNGKVGFSVALRATMDNGKTYAFRIYNDKGTYAYSRSGASGSVAGWGNWKKLDDAAVAALTGAGVEFKLERTAANTLTLSVNGVVVDIYTMEGVTSANKVVSLDIAHYGNKGQKVEIPFALTVPVAVPDVQLNIADLTNGTVTPELDKYQVGDTVTLTVTPDAGYAQKLYVNGQPLMLDWKTNTYSFEATEEVYNITGSFEPVLNLAPSDAGRWDTANQAHGVLNAYYPVNDDSWWMDVKGEYESITVMAKNYLPVADSQDGNGKVGFAVILRVTMDNGKTYAFRVYNDKGTYAYAWYGSGGSVTGWGGWKNIHNAYAADFNGDGVEYKLERTAGDKLTLSLNGNVVETYTMSGVTSANKVVSMSAQHNGNKGVKVEVPFSLTIPVPVPDVQLNIADLTNGTVTADQASYKVGDTVTLTVTPDEGYAQKLYINGQPLMLDYASGKYSFVATEEVYTINGEFVAKNKWFWTADWNLINQGHGIAYAPAHTDGTQRTGDLVPEKGIYNHVNVLFKDVSHGDQKEYALVLKMHFTDGKKAEVRLIDRDDNGKYCLQAMGDTFSNWSTLYWLTDAENAAAKDGDGVRYGMTRIGTDLNLLINGNVVKTIDMSGKGIAADTAIDQIKIQVYNFGYAAEIPYEFKMVEDPTVSVKLPTLANGTVTADKTSYKIGDTVTLTVTPNAGYAQKLFINGKALKLDWKTNTYSFEATEKVYNITGSFESSINAVAKDAGRWDTANQAHGILNTYYPANDDAWWMEIKGNYTTLSVKAKNYLPTADTQDGNGKVGFCVALRATMDNGKTYAFRIYNDKGTYAYSRSGASGSVAGWGNWKKLDDAAVTAITGKGLEFKLERTAANTLTLYINDVAVDTYTMEGVTESNKVVSLDIAHYGNKGQKIEIPFTID